MMYDVGLREIGNRVTVPIAWFTWNVLLCFFWSRWKTVSCEVMSFQQASRHQSIDICFLRWFLLSKRNDVSNHFIAERARPGENISYELHWLMSVQNTVCSLSRSRLIAESYSQMCLFFVLFFNICFCCVILQAPWLVVIVNIINNVWNAINESMINQWSIYQSEIMQQKRHLKFMYK